MVSASELSHKLRNVVSECKILVHSTQNGKRSDNPLHGRITRTQVPPEERQNLTYPLVIYVEHGKPVYLLSCKWQVS